MSATHLDLTSDSSANQTQEDPDTIKYQTAEHLFSEGDADGACAVLLDLVERNTQKWEVYNDLGVYAIAKGEYDTAVHFLDMAVAREDKPHTATGNLACALLLAGKETDSIKVWVHALQKRTATDLAEVLNHYLALIQEKPAILPTLIEQLRQVFTIPNAPHHEDTRTIENSIHVLPLIREKSLTEGVIVIPAEPLPRPEVRYHFSKADDLLAHAYPSIQKYELSNALIHPRSDTLIANKAVLVSDHYNPVEHLLYDTSQAYCTPLPCGELCTIQTALARGHVKKGVVLTSYAAVNWSHFLTEMLPIATLVEHSNTPLDIPLLISDKLHPNMLDMIHRIKAPRREIIEISYPTLIASATYFSPTSTGPFDYSRPWKGDLPQKSAADFLFSPTALALTRQRLQLSEHATGHRKIFISRRSRLRQMKNREEIESFFAQRGFEVVYADKLSAQEQITLFSQAAIIVGQSGAGMANMLFAPPNCRIVIFTLNSPFTPYTYFTNMAGSLGLEIHYLGFTPIPGPGSHPGHYDMEIDLASLAQHAALFT